MQKVYFISGLGADKRAFSLLDLSFCEPVFIDWIQPEKSESLESYAVRLREQIPDQHPTIIGISFGGMLASEMAKKDEKINAIIIASNKSASEFPFYLRLGKYLPLYKWLPASLIKNSYRLKWLFGTASAEHTRLITSILEDVNPDFFKWAIGAILRWSNQNIPANVKHIHGTADKLLPLRFVKADFLVEGGTHLMSVKRPDELSALLKKLVARL